LVVKNGSKIRCRVAGRNGASRQSGFTTSATSPMSSTERRH
jgi:hypothetical protein